MANRGEYWFANLDLTPSSGTMDVVINGKAKDVVSLLVA